MWFLIRAAFWLSIVFAFLPWPEDSPIRQISVALQGGAKAAVMAAIDAARASGVKACADAPGVCVEAAAKLGQFAAAPAAALSSETRQKAAPRPAEPHERSEPR